MMHISLITAMTKERVIGQDNQLPWHIPEDLKLFKQLTMGKPIIMGRRTFESIGKPLPNRHNIIVTHDTAFIAAGCTVAHSIEEALKAVHEVDEIMIIGGANLYQQFLPLATRLYISLIHHDYPGNIFFPKVDWSMWEIKQETIYPAFTHQVLEKQP